MEAIFLLSLESQWNRVGGKSETARWEFTFLCYLLMFGAVLTIYKIAPLLG